jgi:hypothetical protein
MEAIPVDDLGELDDDLTYARAPADHFPEPLSALAVDLAALGDDAEGDNDFWRYWQGVIAGAKRTKTFVPLFAAPRPARRAAASAIATHFEPRPTRASHRASLRVPQRQSLTMAGIAPRTYTVNGHTLIIVKMGVPPPGNYAERTGNTVNARFEVFEPATELHIRVSHNKGRRLRYIYWHGPLTQVAGTDVPRVADVRALTPEGQPPLPIDLGFSLPEVQALLSVAPPVITYRLGAHEFVVQILGAPPPAGQLVNTGFTIYEPATGLHVRMNYDGGRPIFHYWTGPEAALPARVASTRAIAKTGLADVPADLGFLEAARAAAAV